VRVSAREESRALAEERFPRLSGEKERQMAAYTAAVDEELFEVESVRVALKESDLPGRPRSRVFCARCSEGVNDSREVLNAEGRTRCRPCAEGVYYRPLAAESSESL
jgi:formylmethanofuran dehydrogenase subunit E